MALMLRCDSKKLKVRILNGNSVYYEVDASDTVESLSRLRTSSCLGASSRTNKAVHPRCVSAIRRRMSRAQP